MIFWRSKLKKLIPFVCSSIFIKFAKPTYHYTDGTIIPNDIVQAIYWNNGKITNRLNPNITNSNVKGATKYAKTFEEQKIIK